MSWKKIGKSLGGIGKKVANLSPLGKVFNQPKQPNPYDPSGDISQLNQMAAEEQAKREALGKQQQQQINDFVTQQQGQIGDYRNKLAANLANTSQQTFKQAMPGMLEDLNSRGLFTSQTARDQETNRALQELATQQNNILTDYDTRQFGNLQDLQSGGLSALLGGEQSGLDSAMALRKAAIQRQFDVSDQAIQNSFSSYLAKRQQKNDLINSLIGMGGRLGGAAMMA